MTTPTTRILLVEDNPGDVRLMREALAETPDIPFELVHCETGTQAIDFLAKNSVDVVVGGDEFAVLIADAGEANIEAVTHRIGRDLAALNEMPGRHYQLSLSVGIVAAPPDCADLDRLLSEADALMYRQKQHRRASRDPIR